MAREINKTNLKDIFRMLTEIAKGNFAYKIQRTHFDDDIEALSVQLNMMAEELRENLNHLSYVNPHVTYEHLNHSSIIIDDNSKISACTENLFELLGRTSGKIIDKELESLLSSSSLEYWKEIKIKLNENSFITGTYDLEFSTKGNLLIPAKCTISKIFLRNNNSSSLIITFFSTILQKKETLQDKTGGEKQGRTMSKWDVKAIQDIHDYVTENIDEPPLPNIDLAHKFNINEHKLSYGFRQLFGTTPFKLYNKLRLDEAKTLIQNTNNSLEEIAFKLAFKSYPHFSKSFKKRFGYSPRAYRKKIDNGSE